jgi:hypothetical protein
MSQLGLGTSKRPKRLAAKTPLAFRLEGKTIRDFKVEAAMRGLKLNDLFLEMWRLYKQAPRK